MCYTFDEVNRMKANEFWEKVESLRAQKQITQEMMCNKADVQLQSTRNRIYKNRFPTIEETIRILRVLDTSVDEFFGVPADKLKPLFQNDVKMIPVIDQFFSAGKGQFMPDSDDITEYISVPRELLKYGDNLAACHVRGDSMEPTLYDGDTIICDKNGYDGEGVYIIKYQSSGFVKRLQYTTGKVEIISDNPRYKVMSENLESDDLTVIGKVRYVLHKM